MKVSVEPFYVELGRRIQQIRVERRMTQDALGRLLQPPVTRASIANLEIGKQRVLAHTLVQLSKALGVSLQDLAPDVTGEQGGDWDNEALERELKEQLNQLPSRQIRKLVSQIKSGGKRRKR